MSRIFCYILSFFILSACHKDDVTANKIDKRIDATAYIIYEKTKENLKVRRDSLDYFTEQLLKYENSKNPEVKAIAKIFKSIDYRRKTYNELAKKEIDEAINLVPKNNPIQAYALYQKGFLLKGANEYDLAIAAHLEAIKQYEQLKDIEQIANSYAEMGEIYLNKGDLEKAKETLLKATKLLENKKTNYVYLKASQTLANLYGMSNDFESALALDKEGIQLSDSIHSEFYKVTFLSNKANCYLYSNQLDSAKFYFEKCLTIDIKLGNKTHIADSYANLSNWAMLKNDYITAETYAKKGIALFEEKDFAVNLYTSYTLLSNIYEKSNQPQKALEAKKESLKYYKKMTSEKKEKATAEYEIIYETDKKERLLLEKEIIEKKRNTTILLLSLGILVLGLFTYLIYKQQRLKNKQIIKENELKQALISIENQNNLQEQRLAISKDLHDNIGSQLTFIISSLDNLKYFEFTKDKLYSKIDAIGTFTRSTITDLRDTIWAMNKESISFEDLKVRTTNFIEAAKTSLLGINFEFNYPENSENSSLNSLQGIDVYRIIQEAVNNAIKHAQATKIAVHFEVIGKGIEIAIIDNGIGFDATTTEAGNGLSSMQKRAAEIDAIFAIEPLEQGTKVSLKFNIA